MTLTVWDKPAPTSDQHKAERRYKKVVGIVKHNEPIDIPHIGMIYYRSYSKRKHPITPVVKQAMLNGHIRRDKEGFVVMDKLE